MKITFLGSGTSHGVPVIGCHCPVCESSDERDKRYRSSIMLEKDNKRLVIDTGYEFRLQMLRARVDSIDGVLYTHSHADHLSGIDDLRVFTQHKNLPIYGNEKTIDFIKEHYSYAFYNSIFPGVPHFEANVLAPYEKVNISGFEILPVTILHGRMMKNEILGYRIDDKFAYVTDVSYMPDKTIESLKGVETLVIGALRKKPHGAHYSFSEAYSVAKELGARDIYFTHINHETSYKEINSLYSDAKSAYDTLVLEI
ncbi:MBL fold metallo-hydrolase [Spirochaetales bacterium NM-380-WT-3C1]|uniref:MBL fold metallo-hydrolase n=1 Tax=Bullifex porci TaxID=2606638 RepID=A0A7X2PDI0_9SPIO|nr:MBL fold metallo-hydrolase [Bullifex porci]MSU06853.1 MBL fold metallo-hydrolase [Bullifex porci]